MSWRPKDWFNVYNTLYENTKDTETELAVQAGMQGLAFEAGADAILGILKDGAFRLDMENLGCGFTRNTQSEVEPIGWWAYERVANSNMGQGWLVFIPDEVKE